VIINNLFLYMLCFLSGSLGAWVISQFAYRFNLVDTPSHRSSHQKPTPKGGGIGIVAAFITISILIHIPYFFWLPATFLSLISFAGDKYPIRPFYRLAIQFLMCFIVLIGFFLSNTSFLILIPISAFIVGTANYYNFMDGINGIAGITGVIAFGLLAYYAYLFNFDTSLIILSACISLSCLGFLPFNIPDAKVFMGDVGSVLLGFVFASIVVLLSKSLLDFICLVAFLFPFYTDELTTLAVRIKDRDKLTRPHRKHLYQLLANELKIQHWKISVCYGLLQMFVGASVLLLRSLGIFIVLCVLIIYFAGFVSVSYLVRQKVRGKLSIN